MDLDPVGFEGIAEYFLESICVWTANNFRLNPFPNRFFRFIFFPCIYEYFQFDVLLFGLVTKLFNVFKDAFYLLSPTFLGVYYELISVALSVEIHQKVCVERRHYNNN